MINFRLAAILYGAISIFTAFSAFAQPTGNGGGTGKADTYFEGRIDLKFTASGRDAEAILQNNNIQFMTYFFKDGDFIVNIFGPQPEKSNKVDDMFPEGGTPSPMDEVQVFNTSRLYINDSNNVYRMDPENKRAFRTEKKVRKKPSKFPEAKPTGDSLKILNMWCYGFRCQYDNEDITYYVNKNYKVNMGFYKKKWRSKAAWITKGLDGCIPLKTIRKTKNYTIETIATKITPMKLKTEQFRIPKDFKVLPFDYVR